MFDWLHIAVPPAPLFFAQLLVGLINGAFYAMLSLGLAVIFGLLGIVNFAHGALYMIGAYVAWLSLEKFGLNYWFALVLAPLIVGALGVVIERTLLKRQCTAQDIAGAIVFLCADNSMITAQTLVVDGGYSL